MIHHFDFLSLIVHSSSVASYTVPFPPDLSHIAHHLHLHLPLSSSPSPLGPAVMRGPIASRVITQLVSATEWGHLDYLIVDMPPGKYARSTVRICVRVVAACVHMLLIFTYFPS